MAAAEEVVGVVAPAVHVAFVILVAAQLAGVAVVVVALQHVPHDFDYVVAVGHLLAAAETHLEAHRGPKL